MRIGHIAIGLGLKRLHRRINAGLLIFAVLFAYFLLDWFALAGCESYQVRRITLPNCLLFTFPWSHRLLPDLGWAAAFGAVAGVLLRSRRVAAIVGSRCCPITFWTALSM